MAGLTGWHILIVLGIILLLFGATRLPALARAIGQSRNVLKEEFRKSDEDTPSDPGSTPPTDTTPKP